MDRDSRAKFEGLFQRFLAACGDSSERVFLTECYGRLWIQWQDDYEAKKILKLLAPALHVVPAEP